MQGMISSVVIPGMLVVLVALAIMVGCIYLMSRAVGRIERSKKVPDPVVAPPVQKAALTKAAPAPVPEQLDAAAAGETVAAICAAVTCMMPVPHVITGIAPVAAGVAPSAPAVPQRQRPVWGFAGMQQNTRPF